MQRRKGTDFCWQRDCSSFDRKDFFIGSVNFDPRSVFENTEIGVVFSLFYAVEEGIGEYSDRVRGQV